MLLSLFSSEYKQKSFPLSFLFLFCFVLFRKKSRLFRTKSYNKNVKRSFSWNASWSQQTRIAGYVWYSFNDDESDLRGGQRVAKRYQANFTRAQSESFNHYHGFFFRAPTSTKGALNKSDLKKRESESESEKILLSQATKTIVRPSACLPACLPGSLSVFLLKKQLQEKDGGGLWAPFGPLESFVVVVAAIKV